MKILITATPISIENWNKVETKTGMKMEAATAVLSLGDDDFIAAKVFGKDKITALKERIAPQKPVDLVLSIKGLVKQPTPEKTYYENAIMVKWILS